MNLVTMFFLNDLTIIIYMPQSIFATYIRVVYLFFMISVCRELEEMEAKHKFQLSDLEMRYIP